MAAKKLTLSKIFLWILMGMLFVGLAGFGATNLTGTARTIGSVGDKDITIDRYVSGLRQEIRAAEAQLRQPIPFAQAMELGIPDQVLAQLVTARALDHEAGEMGLSIGDAELAQQLRSIPAFNGPDGAFSRDAYRFALQNIGMSESQFEADLRDESARSLLQGAVLAGNAMPRVYAETLVRYALETRDLSWIELDAADLTTGLPVPTDEQLQAHYEANIVRFTRPESRDITYAWLTPDMLLDTVEVEEDLMRKSYEERSAEFNLPERRLVERLIYPDQAAAEAALARIANGSGSFEGEVTARGLDLVDTDMGDVTAEDLGEAASAVFAAELGEVAGPAPTPLGPALFRVNAVLPAQITSFEDARDALRADLALDRARRVISTMAEDMEDRLAGGATLEDLTQETDMVLGQIDWTPDAADIIAGYPAFRDLATSVTEDDFPTITQMGDGGIFALRLNGITPPAPIPFDEARADVAADWDAAETQRLLTEQADALAAQVSATADLASLNAGEVQTLAGVTRTDRIGRLSPAALEAAFGAPAGQAVVQQIGPAVVVIRVDAVQAADLTSEDATALSDALRAQAGSDLAQDLYNALATDIQRRVGVEINTPARTAVHTSLQ